MNNFLNRLGVWFAKHILVPLLIAVTRPRMRKLRRLGRAGDAEGYCTEMMMGHYFNRRGYCRACLAGKDGPVLNADDLPAAPCIHLRGGERYAHRKPVSPRQKRFWLVHHQRHLVFIYFVMAAASAYLALFVTWQFVIIAAVGSPILFVLMLIAVRAEGRHDLDDVLCRWCGSEQTRSKVSVDTHGRHLWWWHHRGRLLILLLSGVAISFIPRIYSNLADYPVGWSRDPSYLLAYIEPFSLLPVAAALIWSFRVDQVHRLLRPWCPLCKNWGGGGEHEVVPDPDPSMTKVTS